MTTRAEATSQSKSAIAKNTLTLFVAIVLSLLLAEVVVRGLGYKPWRPYTLQISVEPGGKLFRLDPVLGYTNLPGQFTLTHATGYKWTATNGPDTLRITEPKTADTGNNSRAEIWIFGCSYTYGWSVNDDENYPWLLNERLPERKIVNFGVGGYGTINSFLQFREALKTRKKPELVIVSYGAFHNARNTGLRKTAKSVLPYSRALGSRWRPYARLSSDRKLVIDTFELEYREFPLMRRSALSHLLETTYNRIEESSFDSHEVSKALLEAFSGLAQRNDIRFLVAGIQKQSARMLDDLTAEGITTADISINLSRKGNRNMPHDGHPSFKAHKAYARRLFESIKDHPLE